jgi:glycosyltransferase involved in cell wall biosynthesis
MKILFTGSYEPDYNRNKIIIAGLKKLGHEVLQYPFKKKSQTDKDLLRQKIADCDFVFMPAFTHREVSFVKKQVGIVGPSPKLKPVIFDPLVSRYMTKVHDYKLVSAFGISALRNFYRDKWSLKAADFVVTDTLAHLEYFHKTFGIAKSKMAPLYIGNDFNEYYPATPKAHEADGIFKVGFYGGFIPLQGVGNILEAARLLRDHSDIVFELIGSGFEFEKAKEFVREHNLTRVSMPGWVNQAELPMMINKFDLALGIFGETVKADLVIPNKIYHYAACAKAIITKRSEAVGEIFTDGQDVLMIDTKPEAIAEAILKLKKDSSLCARLGQAAHATIKNSYSETQMAEKLISYFKAINKS